jgi:signal peptidase I
VRAGTSGFSGPAPGCAPGWWRVPDACHRAWHSGGVDPVTPPDEAQAPEPERTRGGVRSWLRETAIIVVSALVLSVLIKTFLVQSFFIPTSSMESTLEVDDRVLVSKLTPGPFDLHRGDIVVFRDPGGWLEPSEPGPGGWRGVVQDAMTFVGLLPQDAGEHLIKRVIGLPGDTVECCDDLGRVSVNGVPLDEPYVADQVRPSELEFSVVVPPDSLWVMGDNRQNSRDSRYHQGDPGGGAIPMANVVGVAFLTMWPLDRATVLRNPGETFADVP